ncbi:helix-turn-helix transcriptional regulator [Streptomyces sp. NPDC047130]|uniref:helix-turn-helix domain-containing protein n=1 Tax=Streptomyces sp. NPDC047130 TaxID=3155261 RepID=UPI0033FDC875
MHRSSAASFDAAAAHRIRTALGLGPEEVAHGMRTAFGLGHVTPELVTAWERGEVPPGREELTGLAGMLWCSPADLAGRPRTLREHRLARGLTPEEVASAIGLDVLAYLRMEQENVWRGGDRPTQSLRALFRLDQADLVGICGRHAKLSLLLRETFTERGTGPARAVARTASLDRRVVDVALRRLRAGHTAAPDPEAFAARAVDHFWEAVRASA